MEEGARAMQSKRGREKERRAPNGREKIEERARTALPPFVEKGRRNYVVAQLMRPRGTIIW